MNGSGSIMRVIVLSVCVLGAAAGAAAEIPVVINEFLASNTEYMADPQGQYDDWIELYNLGAEPVDVGGLYLTDNLSVPAKWQIPPDAPVLTTIPAGGFLVIWADNDLADPGLHAPFLLSAGGEELALVDVDGVTLIDSIRFGQQITDVSYGRFPDGTDTWSQMMFPTPGGPNIRVFQGVAAEPRISPDHGFCDGPITVTIACDTPDVTIYYTTDGSSPYTWDSSRPSASAAVYQGPIQISRTTCLRATAVKLGWRPSPIETRTYIFVEDVIHQSPNGEPPGPGWPSGSVNGQTIDYGMDPDVVNDVRYKDRMDDALLAIPSISLVTDLANLFDSRTGIYVNARSQGQGWERPTSFELIYPDETEGFQVDAGLRIRGGYSRSGGNPKHAFRLFFRTEYGMSKLRYPLFGDEGVDEFENIDLRTSQNYSWSFEGGNRDTFVREVFSRDTQRDMAQPYTRSRYYHLYINGHYWGLFQTQERSEASYAETYFGDAKEDYDVIKSRAGNGGYDIEATDGNLDAWRELWEATETGFDNDEIYYRVQGLNPDGTPNPQYPKLLDIDNLIDYMLCTYYVGDPDGPVSAWARVANNFYAIYNRARPDGFVFFRHDAEHSLYDVYESRLFAATTLAVGSRFNQSNPLWLHTHLIVHPEYRMRFVDRVHKYFFNDGLLAPQPCIDRFMARAAEIDMAIIA
ncbi:MAG: CotH kinase family protein, partial [Sedimentisphaerales bacterium]|nr:CotH kinase family protein [Sedimentisphaerales bacterium]